MMSRRSGVCPRSQGWPGVMGWPHMLHVYVACGHACGVLGVDAGSRVRIRAVLWCRGVAMLHAGVVSGSGGLGVPGEGTLGMHIRPCTWCASWLWCAVCGWLWLCGPVCLTGVYGCRCARMSMWLLAGGIRGFSKGRSAKASALENLVPPHLYRWCDLYGRSLVPVSESRVYHRFSPWQHAEGGLYFQRS